MFQFWNFCGYVYMMAGCLCLSCLHSDDIIIPWGMTKRADFVIQSFFDSRLQYGSLEPLVDFLAFQVPKLWPNVQKLNRENLQLPVGSPSCFPWDTKKLCFLCAFMLSRKKIQFQLVRF